jgi:hypothetical protein
MRARIGTQLPGEVRRSDMKRLVLGVLVAVLVLALIAPAVLAKPDMNKPLPATNVELVKKVTLHGKPGGGGGGRPVKQVATGMLGEQLGTGADKYAVMSVFPITPVKEAILSIAMMMHRICTLP